MAEGKVKKRGLWTVTDMKKAITALMTKNITYLKAVQDYGVPFTTLRRRFLAIQAGEEVDFSPHIGRFTTTFDKNLEDQLVLYVKLMDSRLMPFSKMEFLKFVYDLATHMHLPHQFSRDGKSAGNKFYHNFMTRHPDLSLRTPQSTSYQRAVGFNKTQVDMFFSKYTELVEKYNFTAERIFNCDETGVSIVQNNSTKVLSVNGKKQVSTLTAAERGRNVTVLLTINAAGSVFIPPMFIFPNKKRIDQVLKVGAPVGSIFAAEETGWITAKSFKNWLEMFAEKTMPSKDSPVLLVLDGHVSHKDLSVIMYAKEHHIHMLSLPPHTTHKMQPLDRAIMRPFKGAYNRACDVWIREHHPLKIALKDISGLVKTAFQAICRMELSQSAFRCTGLWPVDPGVFTEDDFVPSEYLREPESGIEECHDQNEERDTLIIADHHHATKPTQTKKRTKGKQKYKPISLIPLISKVRVINLLSLSRCHFNCRLLFRISPSTVNIIM